jgi:hypothetical protein
MIWLGELVALLRIWIAAVRVPAAVGANDWSFGER